MDTGRKIMITKKHPETKMLQRRNRIKYKEKGPSLKLKTIIYPDLNRTGNSCDPTPEFFVVDSSSTILSTATSSTTTITANSNNNNNIINNNNNNNNNNKNKNKNKNNNNNYKR